MSQQVKGMQLFFFFLAHIYEYLSLYYVQYKNCQTFLSPWVVTDQFLGNGILIFIRNSISLMVLLYKLEQLIFQELSKSQILKGRVNRRVNEHDMQLGNIQIQDLTAPLINKEILDESKPFLEIKTVPKRVKLNLIMNLLQFIV